jgi:hypothetical protein
MRRIRPPFQFEATPAPTFHPEFGYFCPSPVARRGFRVALISAVVGMLIGAVIVLSLVDRRFADGEQKEQTTAWRADRILAAVDQAEASENHSENHAELVDSQDKGSMPTMQNGCTDGAASFLDPKCRLAKKPKGHPSRSIRTRLTSTVIGRVRSIADAEEPVSTSENGKLAKADGGRANISDASRDLSIVPSERAPSSAAKSARIARHRALPRSPKANGIDAFAYVPPYAQYYHYGDTYRSKQEAVKGSWNWPVH